MMNLRCFGHRHIYSNILGLGLSIPNMLRRLLNVFESRAFVNTFAIPSVLGTKMISIYPLRTVVLLKTVGLDFEKL